LARIHNFIPDLLAVALSNQHLEDLPASGMFDRPRRDAQSSMRTHAPFENQIINTLKTKNNQ
jgi:hypothetical protein